MHGPRALHQVYREQIDPEGTHSNVLGFFVGVIGSLMGHVGVSAFVISSYAPGFLDSLPFRETGVVVAALGLATMVYGDVLRIPRSFVGDIAAVLGLLLSVVAAARFVTVYPGGWLLPGDAAIPVALYVVGIGLLTAAESVIPLLTPPQGGSDGPSADESSTDVVPGDATD